MKRFACCPVCAHKLCEGEKGCHLDIKCPRCGEVIHIEIGDVITTRIVCLIVFAVRVQSGITDKSSAIFLFTCRSALCYPCNRVYHRLIDKDTGETDDGCNDYFSAVRYAIGYHVSGGNAA